MKRAYFNCILLDGTEQMEPVAHKMVLADGEKITAIVEDTAPCEGYEKVDLKGGYLMPGSSTCMSIWRATASPAQSPGITPHWCAGS